MVNKQKIRYWAQENPHWYAEKKEQGAARLMVWLGVWNQTFVGPFFFDGTVTGDNYLNMIANEMMPHLHALGGPPEWFQQDGAPPHFAHQARHFLDDQFPDHWIGRGGPVEWSPRSPDLNPLDFSIWGLLKDKVYSEEIRDLQHLRHRIEEECRNFPVSICNTLCPAWRGVLSCVLILEANTLSTCCESFSQSVKCKKN